MTFLSIILFFVLFSRTSQLTRTISKLTSEIESLKNNSNSGNLKTNTESYPRPIPSSMTSQAGSPLMTPEEILNTKKIYVSENQTSEDSPLVKWLSENTMLKLGVGLVLLGFGWFVSYAFIHNWIGPVGRISLGFLAGVIVTAVGSWRLSKDETQGITLSTLGSALITITAIAGHSLYNFYPESAILVIVFITSVYTSLSAIAWSTEKLATYSVFLSLLAPVLARGSKPDFVFLMSYLLVISIGTIWISVVKKWKNPVSVGITGVFLYSIILFFPGSTLIPSKYSVLAINYIISLIYLLVSISALVKRSENPGNEDLYLTVLNTGMILGITVGLVPPVYQSMFISLWMLVYGATGYYIFVATNKEKLMYIHALFSVLFLGVATSIELSGQTLTIALAIEAAIVTLASYLITKKYENARRLSLLTVIPFLLSIPSFLSTKWNYGIFHSDMVVLAIIALILFVIAQFLSTAKKSESGAGDIDIEVAYYIASSVYVFGIIWLSAHYLFSKDTAAFFSIFIYTVVGLYCHFSGIVRQKKVLKNYGIAVLACVVLRLLFVEIWDMDIVLRVITFLVIGVMFIGTAFMSKKYKN